MAGDFCPSLFPAQGTVATKKRFVFLCHLLSHPSLLPLPHTLSQTFAAALATEMPSGSADNPTMCAPKAQGPSALLLIISCLLGALILASTSACFSPAAHSKGSIRSFHASILGLTFCPFQVPGLLLTASVSTVETVESRSVEAGAWQRWI